MISYKTIINSLIVGLLLTSCNNNDQKADAYGNFEATETIISSETNGKITMLNISEGQQLTKGTIVAQIDTMTLALKRNNLKAAKGVIYAKSRGVLSQINVIQSQKLTAEKNKVRIENLIKDKLASQKQLDDINGQIDAYNNQIESVRSQNQSVLDEVSTIDAQLEELEHQIVKSKIINPVNGVVLTKYAEVNEVIGFGRPLYKIANLSKMTFRGYIGERQLASINIGDEVAVYIDVADGSKAYKGTVTWIASEAEFTPKIIQTKEERVNLVYAIKVSVLNDGGLKIGMPAEMEVRSEKTKSE